MGGADLGARGHILIGRWSCNHAAAADARSAE